MYKIGVYLLKCRTNAGYFDFSTSLPKSAKLCDCGKNIHTEYINTFTLILNQEYVFRNVTEDSDDLGTPSDLLRHFLHIFNVLLYLVKLISNINLLPGSGKVVLLVEDLRVVVSSGNLNIQSPFKPQLRFRNQTHDFFWINKLKIKPWVSCKKSYIFSVFSTRFPFI